MTWNLKNPVAPKAWGFGGKAPAGSASFNITRHPLRVTWISALSARHWSDSSLSQRLSNAFAVVVHVRSRAAVVDLRGSPPILVIHASYSSTVLKSTKVGVHGARRRAVKAIAVCE